MKENYHYASGEREIGAWLNDINALLQELAPGKLPINKEYLCEVIKKGNLLVARDTISEKKRIVGMGFISFSCAPSGVSAKIADVVVLQSHRNKGLGKRIVMTLLEDAERLGATYVELSNNINKPNRMAARKLYEKLGFQPVDTYMRYYFTKKEEPEKLEVQAEKNEES